MARVEIRVPSELWVSRDWSGVLASWHVGVGDKVARGMVVAEVEVEKAVLEIESPCNGVVVELLVPERGPVKPGQAIAVVEADSC